MRTHVIVAIGLWCLGSPGCVGGEAGPNEPDEHAALTTATVLTSYGATSRDRGGGAIDTTIPYPDGAPHEIFHFVPASSPSGADYVVNVEVFDSTGVSDGGGGSGFLGAAALDLDGANQAAAIALDNAAQPPGNSAGCDAQASPLSCTGVGACCDTHDQCIHDNCPADCGNVVSIFKNHCGQACLGCHYNVIACILKGLRKPPAQRPGPSNCCARGDCGKKQACQKNNITYTDPCDCKRLGLPITPGMECAED